MNKGYTLVEILVVTILISILVAISYPSYLNVASKAKEAEGSANVGRILDGIREYYEEYGRFPPDLTYIELGNVELSKNYSYTLEITPGSAVTVVADPKTPNTVKPIVGALQLNKGMNQEGGFMRVVCKGRKPGKGGKSAVVLAAVGKRMGCGSGYGVVE